MCEYQYECELSGVPYPCLRISITTPDDQKAQETKAILDSGAARTCVPLKVIRALGMSHPADKHKFIDFDNNEVELSVFYVNVLAAGRTIQALVVGTNSNHALLGRDILNNWILTLDGPRRQFGVE